VSWQAEEEPAPQQQRLHGGTYKYFIRGQDSVASDADYKIEHIRKQRLRPYDVFLKKFQYHDALNAALEVSVSFDLISISEMLSRCMF
jgi:U3 small nucleolar RNA-associated protein 15